MNYSSADKSANHQDQFLTSSAMQNIPTNASNTNTTFREKSDELYKSFKHVLRVMKITIAIMTLFFVQVSAATFAQRISLDMKDKSIFTVLEEIRKQTNYDFSYDREILNSVSPITIKVKSANLKQVLHSFLDQHQLTFTLKDDFIVITKGKSSKGINPYPSMTRQQMGRISGKVLSHLGSPLPGASVKVLQNNQTVQSSVDGSYSIDIKAGSYTIEASYISFQTKRITEIEVTGGNSTNLNIVLNEATNTLSQVVVTGSYKKESIAGLLTQQKNAASVTDGISAEQIARTADNNIGQVLKRVSGVTTIDNKYVVVRGLSDRYNQAMVDGVVLPSTSMNRRNFSFDVVPQELVSNVVINKTATPDMSAEFSGGQVSVNTMDIPTENFASLSLGTGINSQNSGRTFLSLGERKNMDYLGLSSYRDEPKGLQSWYWQSGVTTPPLGPNGTYPTGFPKDLELIPGSGIPYTSFDAIEQSRRLDANALLINGYKPIPFQNMRLALGRVYDLKNNLNIGFSVGATYRNQQTITNFNNVRGNAGPEYNYIDSVENNPGSSYNFNSTIGALLNLGLKGNNFKIALKNMYSHVFQDRFNETFRINYGASNEVKSRELFQDPQATAVWQHKLEGQQIWNAPGINIDYTLGMTRIQQNTQDQRRLKYRLSMKIGDKEYFQTPDVYDPSRLDDWYDYRMWTDVKEKDYNWGISFSKSFKLGKNISNFAKLGYNGWNKHRTLGITKLIPYSSSYEILNPITGGYWDVLSAEQVGAGKGQAFYWAEDLNGPTFDGTMSTHATYLMLDQRFFEKLRLVYGIRAEHYNLANRQEEYIKRRFGNIDDNWAKFSTTGEKDWRLLPSINLTYNLTPQMNARLAYSKTAIRPDFRETAYFGYYDIDLEANITGRQLVSTIIDNFDIRYEWYPTAGEIISISGFYKNMKNPIELVWVQDGHYRFQNQYSAKNYGLELEVRKSLGFLAEKAWLSNISLFGNGTVIKSLVEVQDLPMPGENKQPQRFAYLNRPLYGQAPWVVNAGIAYQDQQFGFTASYNRSGHRSNTINLYPSQVEYEDGRNMLDLQFSSKILKRKAEIKLDVTNILDEYIQYYQNINAYEQQELSSSSAPFKLKKDNSTAYNAAHGDRVTYRAKTGRNIALSFIYKF